MEMKVGASGEVTPQFSLQRSLLGYTRSRMKGVIIGTFIAASAALKNILEKGFPSWNHIGLALSGMLRTTWKNIAFSANFCCGLCPANFTKHMTDWSAWWWNDWLESSDACSTRVCVHMVVSGHSPLLEWKVTWNGTQTLEICFAIMVLKARDGLWWCVRNVMLVPRTCRMKMYQSPQRGWAASTKPDLGKHGILWQTAPLIQCVQKRYTNVTFFTLQDLVFSDTTWVQFWWPWSSGVTSRWNPLLRKEILPMCNYKDLSVIASFGVLPFPRAWRSGVSPGGCLTFPTTTRILGQTRRGQTPSFCASGWLICWDNFLVNHCMTNLMVQCLKWCSKWERRQSTFPKCFFPITFSWRGRVPCLPWSKELFSWRDTTGWPTNLCIVLIFAVGQWFQRITVFGTPC